MAYPEEELEKSLLGLDAKRRHTHLLRAAALKMAIDMPEAYKTAIYAYLVEQDESVQYVAGFAKIELLADHLLRYVLTGTFDDYRNS